MCRATPCGRISTKLGTLRGLTDKLIIQSIVSIGEGIYISREVENRKAKSFLTPHCTTLLSIYLHALGWCHQLNETVGNEENQICKRFRSASTSSVQLVSQAKGREQIKLSCFSVNRERLTDCMFASVTIDLADCCFWCVHNSIKQRVNLPRKWRTPP